MTPQENIEAMASDIAAMKQMVRGIQRSVLVIAIPFWLTLIGFLVAVAFWVVVVFIMAGQ